MAKRYYGHVECVFRVVGMHVGRSVVRFVIVSFVTVFHPKLCSLAMDM